MFSVAVARRGAAKLERTPRRRPAGRTEQATGYPTRFDEIENAKPIFDSAIC